MGVSQAREPESITANQPVEYTSCDISEDLILLIPNAVARETIASAKLAIQAPDLDGSLSETELADLMSTFTRKIVN